MNLFGLLSRQRRFIYLAVALATAGGIWAATRLPSAIYPELVFPRIAIVALGSSLGARQVVFSVVRPIEEAVSVVPGVRRVRSRAIRGAAEFSIYFAPSTDMAYALQLVQARINQVRSDLPANLEIEVERLTPSVFPILSYNLEGGDPATLYDIARYQIRPVLSRVPGVGRVDVQASDVREIEVVADPNALAGHGLTYDDVATAIREAVTPAAVGRVALNYRQYLVVLDQEARTVEDIGAVALPGGLRVRDVASVEIGTEDHTRIIAGEGRPVASLNITRQIGGNTIAVADSIAGAVRALSKTLPPGVQLRRVYDQAELVRDAVRSVRDAMLIGAFLAVVVLLLFLRHGRITAISATSIPLTLAITCGVMSLLGQTFNLMTLGAMAIAIGLVIDDAVVVTENIARHVRLTPDRTVAIREAVQELIWPVTTSTITTVVVFLPLGLLEGVVGQFFVALSVTLTIAVLVSLVLAITVIPLLCAQYITAHDVEADAREPERGPAKLLARVGRGIDGLADRYERGLGAALRHPGRLVVASLVLVVLGVVAQRFVGTGFLPEMDEGAFVLDFWTPGSTSLAESDRMVRVAENILTHTPEIAGTSRRLGGELGLFATEQNRGDIVARLTPNRSRDIEEVIDEVRKKIGAAVPRLRIEFVQILADVLGDLAGDPRPVEIKLFGNNLEQLEGYARTLAPPLDSIDGLEDFYNGISEPSAEMLMKVDEVEAARTGLTPADVGQLTSAPLLGVSAGEVRLDDRTIGVRVRAPDRVRYDPARLTALPLVAGPSKRVTPLGALVSMQSVDTRAELLRENQQQLIALTADLSNRSLGDVMRDVRRVLAAHPAPAGVRVEIGGQYAGQQQAFRALLVVLALATASVIAVMVIQFESFVEPLIVVLAAPVSFVGAIALLLITRVPLNVSSFMGLILLVGLIVKNGIILLDFTKLRMEQEGVDLETAIREAARVRLRPILMTTLCTLFGLLPLALGLGAGSELQKPLALAVIGGLALSTPITLFIVPTLLVAVRGRDYTMKRSTA
ncbi:MAG TPA: efflux RND transporter permease subunit [Gemmatimonadales bacterium]